MRSCWGVVLVAWAASAAAVDFEIPAAEPPAASLPADWVSGPDFTIHEPVTSDGLMRRYQLQSRFGTYGAYGREALGVRVREVAALAQMSKNDDVAIVIKAAVRQFRNQFDTSAAERRFYQQLGVDPYTDNDVLRKAVKRAAKVDAAASLGMHFVGVPGLPYIGDVRRAMDAIYTEDPAVLRARRAKELLGYGLTPAELKRFDTTLLLSPTRQGLLEEAAKTLNGVAGRDELFRHAMEVDSPEEVQVFIRSAHLLASLHALRPVATVLGGVRLPAAVLADGTLVVCGAFDDVYWTDDVARDEESLRAALTPGDAPRELWITGGVSPVAREELVRRKWVVHDRALENL